MGQVSRSLGEDFLVEDGVFSQDAVNVATEGFALQVLLGSVNNVREKARRNVVALLESANGGSGLDDGCGSVGARHAAVDDSDWVAFADHGNVAEVERHCVDLDEHLGRLEILR